LSIPGLLEDLGANHRHRLLNFDAGLSKVAEQRLGEGAVGAFLAI
jgi:hypothetical protein